MSVPWHSPVLPRYRPCPPPPTRGSVAGAASPLPAIPRWGRAGTCRGAPTLPPPPALSDTTNRRRPPRDTPPAPPLSNKAALNLPAARRLPAPAPGHRGGAGPATCGRGVGRGRRWRGAREEAAGAPAVAIGRRGGRGGRPRHFLGLIGTGGKERRGRQLLYLIGWGRIRRGQHALIGRGLVRRASGGALPVPGGSGGSGRMVSVCRAGAGASACIGPGRCPWGPGMGVRGLGAPRSPGRGLLCRAGAGEGGSAGRAGSWACGRPEPPMTGTGAGAAPRAVRARRRVRALRRAGGGGDQPAAAAGTGRGGATGGGGLGRGSRTLVPPFPWAARSGGRRVPQGPDTHPLQVEESVLTIGKFHNVVKLVAFAPFKSAQSALENINAVSEGERAAVGPGAPA